MATIEPVITDSVSEHGGVKDILWSGLANAGDVGDWVRFAEYAGKTFHVYGTFSGSASVSIQGSNELIPTSGNAVVLSDWQGNPMSGITAAALKTPRDMPVWIRPILTAGAAASVTVQAAVHRVDMGA